MNKRKNSFFIKSWLLLNYVIIFMATAQSDFSIESGNKLTANVTSEIGYISNFLYQNTSEQDTSYWKVTPNVFFQTQMKRHLLQFNTQISHVSFNEFMDDDHSNIMVSPKYHFKIDNNKTLSTSLSYKEQYEYRGTGVSFGEAESISTGDEFKNVELKMGYLYGHHDSVAKLKIEVGLLDFSYLTRRAITQQLDREETFSHLSFDYLLSGKSYLATDVEYREIRSPNNALLDKDKVVMLAGWKWQSTGITEFQALIGYQQIDFSAPELASDDGFKWQVNANWKPSTFSLLSLTSNRDFEEANRLSNSYRVVDRHKIELMNKFTDYFQASAAIGFRKEEVIYSNEVNEEHYSFYELSVNYQRNEWLRFYSRFVYSDMDATLEAEDYQRHSISVGFSVII
jgi:hypothetical protein